MTQRRSAVTPYRVVLFFATVFALTTLIFLVHSNLFSQRREFQESDYIMTFYVAGHLAAGGRADELYPNPDARSFVDSPFDRAAHALLPNLHKQSTGAYMYIPLVAGVFAPLSFIDPNWSLLVWQVLSVLALGACCYLLSHVTQVTSHDMFFLSFLFAPIFLTLWAGQLGLTFGLLPLCVGYVLVLKQREFIGGLVWSLLLLKPQFFLAAAFVAITLALMRRHRAFFGMTIGVLALIGLTILIFGIGPTTQWLVSHRVSDATYSSGLQGIPSHLITGLPANLMILFPVEQRAAVKLPLYAAAAVLWIFGLWFCFKLGKSHEDQARHISLSLVIGLFFSSLTLPHLLYYDLCLLLPVGVLLIARNGPLSGHIQSRWMAIFGWIVISVFLPLLLAFAKNKVLPLVLEIILSSLLIALLWHFNRHSQLTRN
ncbi:MAG: hypothetical protein HW419_2617 [Deltaproteobacteria bacterium]|nr:hypothetical protein [Deltaproteobacteria bacterium]